MNFYNIIDLKINGKFAIKFDYHLGDTIQQRLKQSALLTHERKKN